jgi:hypothetical protein
MHAMARFVLALPNATRPIEINDGDSLLKISFFFQKKEDENEIVVLPLSQNICTL